MPSMLTGAILLGAGLALGLLIMWLVSEARLSHLRSSITNSSAELAAKNGRVESLTSDLQRALEAKARAEQDAQRVPDLEDQLGRLREVHNELQIHFAELRTAREADKEKVLWVERAQETLREAFKALAAESLQTNADAVFKRAGEQLEPLATALRELDEQVHALEEKREGAYQGVQEQLRQLAQTHNQLQSATVTLGQALKSPVVRGRWGEIQLRRVVELAGMVAHVDFSEQAVTDGGRPDMVVRLTHGGVLPIDAKAPMQAYLEALETSDQSARDAKLDLYVRAFRQHVQHLGSRRYWQQFERAPELVIMFVPNEAVLATVFDRDATLLESAMQQRVLLTTPITLLALLGAVAYGWQQHQVAENARQIAEHARQLHERLRVFLKHLCEVGKRLDRATESYNEAVASLEGRVLPAAHRFREMGVAGEELPVPLPVERRSRLPASVDAEGEASSPLNPLPSTPGEPAPHLEAEHDSR